MTSEPLRLIFAGTPEFAAIHLRALLSSPHELVAVYTQPDRPAGRGKKLQASPVKEVAAAADIPVLQPPSLRSADPRYGHQPGTASFCNADDALLPLADLWLHGHLHAPSDYTAQGQRSDGSPWQCRVVANPLGYARKGEQATFQPRF